MACLLSIHGLNRLVSDVLELNTTGPKMYIMTTLTSDVWRHEHQLPQ